MKLNILIYVMVETIAFAVIALLAFTTFNNQYLFGWVADNWIFSLGLIGITLLLLLFNKKIVLVFMTTGIVVGIFIGNYFGKLLVAFNVRKIVESMNAEEIYRLHHHPGFEIWIGTIFLFVLIGIIAQIACAKKRTDNK